MKMARVEKPFATPGKTYKGILGEYNYLLAINEKGVVCIKFTPR